MLGELVEEDVALLVVILCGCFIDVDIFEKSGLLGIGGTENFSGLSARLDTLRFTQDSFGAGEILGFTILDGIVDDGAHVIVEKFARFVVLAALI